MSVPEPYRLFFPLGVLYALLAAAVWPLYALGRIAYPAALHWTLMVQGFLHCFVLGFLLTALPAFLHVGKVRPKETIAAAASMVGFGAFAISGMPLAAQGAYLASLLVLLVTGARRLPTRRGNPPEEFIFVAAGIVLAAAGGIVALLVLAYAWSEPAPRLSLHLITRGAMLSIVLGVGGLLVPTFSSMREPLVVPGVARAGERLPRRALYVPLAVLLMAACVLDSTGRPELAGWIRAVVALLLGMLVWKLFRRPGTRTLLSWAIWSSGWFVLAGVWAAAVLPARAVLSYHVVFLGGFSLLIMGIATRVVVRHGGYPLAHERHVLRPISVAALGLALLARVGAEFSPRSANLHYAMAGVLWIAAWLVWSRGAMGCILRPLAGRVSVADSQSSARGHRNHVMVQSRP